MSEHAGKNLFSRRAKRQAPVVPQMLVPHRFILALLLFFVGPPARATPTCDALEALAPASPDQARTWVTGIWEGLVAALASLDGGAVLPTLRLVGSADLAAGAWFCQRSSTVYVSSALVDYAWSGRGSDGAELMAFALAHELAHARFDTGDRQLGGRCPDQDAALEARADRRAAFLVALASDPGGRRFRPATLVRRDALKALFTAELGWAADCPALSARLAAVEVALAKMDDLARVFEVALVLSAAGSGATTTVLAALHEVVRGRDPLDGGWDALPELAVLRATHHLKRAASVGWCQPAITNAGLVPDPCMLPCPIIVPGRSRLSPDLPGERRRTGRDGPDGVDAPMELLVARLMLDMARLQGVQAADLAGAEACHAYLSGDPMRGLRALEGLRPLDGARVRAAVRDLRSLFAVQQVLVSQTPRSEGWRRELVALERRLGWDGSPAVAALKSWIGGNAVAVPYALSFVTPELAACQQVASTRPIVVGELEVRTANGCTEVRTARQVVVMRSALRAASVPAMGDWSAACRLAAPTVTHDGRSLVGARCPGEQSWVLELVGSTVQGATLIEVVR